MTQDHPFGFDPSEDIEPPKVVPFASWPGLEAHDVLKWGVPDNLVPGILNYFNHGIEAGGFMMAVLENNLMEAMGRADENSRAHLFNITSFLYNGVPSGTYGSPRLCREFMEARRARTQ